MTTNNEKYYLQGFDFENEDDLTVIWQFYQDNPSEFVVFGRDEEIDPYNYVGLYEKDTHELVAITSWEYITHHLVQMWSTVVREDRRGQGVGTALNKLMEEYLKFQGFGKISTNIYIKNLPSIFLKMKLGYIIEGTLKDHDKIGQHEYKMGKLL